MSATAMAAPSSQPAADAFLLPQPGSLYYDYLAAFPVGVPHVVEMYVTDDQPCFTVTKTFTGETHGDDRWAGLPGVDGLATTRELYEYVKKARAPGDAIYVMKGVDPRKVKQEYVELGEEDL